VEVTPIARAAPAQLAAPRGFVAVGAKILSWIVDQFAKLQASALSIAGPAQLTPGTTATYQVRLDAPYAIQNDSSQGVYMQRWCDVALVGKTGSVVSETGFAPCADAYARDYTVSLPAGSYQDYLVVAVMVETRQDYVNGGWKTTYEQSVIQKESFEVTGRVLEKPTQGSAPQGILGVLSRLWAWISGLWT
jgi:hypothetical protein